jgi:lipopolysaccharide transport system ATP-binding protein
VSTVIKIENLSKSYRLGEVGTGTISHDLNRLWASIRGKEDPYAIIGSENDRTKVATKGEIVNALSDINLEIQQGEVLGIIGKNGAGKSTLLKILSRITSPTTGIYKIKGRMASLLEVGTGFHPEMTGRENIYMNGTIMGMRKHEIDAKLEEIVEFAGVAKYIDTPVKRYSSGMTVRLGFSVAAHLDSEILVVDEVLAVGDAEFQKKAIGKMQDVSKGQGRTVLFVSHNMDSIKSLCNRGVMLKNGMIDFIGNINQTIEHYIQENKNITHKNFNLKINEQITLIDAIFHGEQNKSVEQIMIGEKWKVKIKFKIESEINNLIIGIGLTTITNSPIFSSWSESLNLQRGDYEIEFISDKIFLQAGFYKLLLGLTKGKESLYYSQDFMQFEVVMLSKKFDKNLVKVDGTTGIIINQMTSSLTKV